MADRMPRQALAPAQPPVPDFHRDGCALALDHALAIGKIRLLAADFTTVFGAAPPAARRQIDHDGATFAWLAPGEWLVTGPREAVAAALARADGELALTIDISHGRIAFILSGAEVRTAIAAVSPLDAGERAFPVGGGARTLLGDTGMFIARLPDRADGPQFRIIVDQTMAGYAARMLSEPGERRRPAQ
jgi:sarcosine oxidase subunit gamma